MSHSRQLAAIMFTDIVGYTALMGKNEQKAFALLKKNRLVQRPIIEHHHGKWLKEMGDGVLASFDSVSDAVYAAIEIQEACKKEDDLLLKIGIHLGEVVFDGGDVFGDGVNIASRLEPLAPPGGILISEAVQRNIKNKPGLEIEFLREEILKNVEEPIKIYQVRIGTHMVEGSDQYLPEKNLHSKQFQFKKKKLAVLIAGILLLVILGFIFYPKNQNKNKKGLTNGVETVNEEKSIAVLPFINMSNDPQQEYFSEGMMDEILDHLYKIGGLGVISRTSSMAYKGTKKTSKEIANELGVNYLLESSVQKDKDHIRIIVQLINGKTDKYLWADTYDREFKDVFAIQSDIAQKIASALKIKIDPNTKSRIEYIPTASTNAYNLYLQSKEKFTFDKSWKELLEKVIQLDSSFAPAYADLAFSWIHRGSYSGDLNAKQILDNALPLLKKAIQLDSNLSSAHNYMALAYLWFEWDFKSAETEWEKCFQLNPSGYFWASNYIVLLQSSGRFQEALYFSLKNRKYDKRDVDNWIALAKSYYYMDQPGKALIILDSAWLLFKDPRLFFGKSWIFTYLGKYQQVIDNLNKYLKVFQDDRNLPRLQAWLAISYFQTGREGEPEKILESLQSLSKKSSVGSPAFHVAMIYSATGRSELALKWLEKAYTGHEVEMFWVKVEPLFRPLHGDKRFQNIVKRIGYPE